MKCLPLGPEAALEDTAWTPAKANHLIQQLHGRKYLSVSAGGGSPHLKGETVALHRYNKAVSFSHRTNITTSS